MIVTFIDDHRVEHGVEPICKVLQVAPSTYYSARSRPPSGRALRDVVLMALIVTLWQANYRVYGVRKMWKALTRAGEAVDTAGTRWAG